MVDHVNPTILKEQNQRRRVIKQSTKIEQITKFVKIT